MNPGDNTHHQQTRPSHDDAPRTQRSTHSQHQNTARSNQHTERPPHRKSPRHTPPHHEPPTADPFKNTYDDSGTRKRWMLIAIAVGAVVVLTTVLLSLAFSGATVTVYPKQDTIAATAEFQAAISPVEGAITFKRVTIEQTARRNVTALNESEVSERAQGSITIYNESTDGPMRLIRRTRFESPAGLMYWIQEPVEVPGKQPDGTPGEVEVAVAAMETGEQYNITGPTEFTVPGLEGTTYETEVYARSTEDITGGFEGVRRTVSEDDRVRATDALESQLRDELLAALEQSSEVPEGNQIFPEAVFFEFTPQADEIAATDEVQLSLSGKLHAITFDRDTFARRVAELTIGSYAGTPIRIDNIDELTVNATPVTTEDEAAAAPWNADTYQITATGKAKFVWEYDIEEFKTQLAGKPKDILSGPAASTFLDTFPGIDYANGVVRPFWFSTYPEDTTNISVTTKLDD